MNNFLDRFIPEDSQFVRRHIYQAAKNAGTASFKSRVHSFAVEIGLIGGTVGYAVRGVSRFGCDMSELKVKHAFVHLGEDLSSSLRSLTLAVGGVAYVFFGFFLPTYVFSSLQPQVKAPEASYTELQLELQNAKKELNNALSVANGAPAILESKEKEILEQKRLVEKKGAELEGLQLQLSLSIKLSEELEEKINLLKEKETTPENPLQNPDLKLLYHKISLYKTNVENATKEKNAAEKNSKQLETEIKTLKIAITTATSEKNQALNQLTTSDIGKLREQVKYLNDSKHRFLEEMRKLEEKPIDLQAVKAAHSHYVDSIESNKKGDYNQAWKNQKYRLAINQIKASLGSSDEEISALHQILQKEAQSRPKDTMLKNTCTALHILLTANDFKEARDQHHAFIKALRIAITKNYYSEAMNLVAGKNNKCLKTIHALAKGIYSVDLSDFSDNLFSAVDKAKDNDSFIIESEKNRTAIKGESLTTGIKNREAALRGLNARYQESALNGVGKSFATLTGCDLDPTLEDLHHHHANTILVNDSTTRTVTRIQTSLPIYQQKVSSNQLLNVIAKTVNSYEIDPIFLAYLHASTHQDEKVAIFTHQSKSSQNKPISELLKDNHLKYKKDSLFIFSMPLDTPFITELLKKTENPISGSVMIDRFMNEMFPPENKTTDFQFPADFDKKFPRESVEKLFKGIYGLLFDKNEYPTIKEKEAFILLSYLFLEHSTRIRYNITTHCSIYDGANPQGSIIDVLDHYLELLIANKENNSEAVSDLLTQVDLTSFLGTGKKSMPRDHRNKLTNCIEMLSKLPSEKLERIKQCKTHDWKLKDISPNQKKKANIYPTPKDAQTQTEYDVAIRNDFAVQTSRTGQIVNMETNCKGTLNNDGIDAQINRELNNLKLTINGKPCKTLEEVNTTLQNSETPHGIDPKKLKIFCHQAFLADCYAVPRKYYLNPLADNHQIKHHTQGKDAKNIIEITLNEDVASIKGRTTFELFNTDNLNIIGTVEADILMDYHHSDTATVTLDNLKPSSPSVK